MSIKAISWAFEQKLKPGPKLVLLKLADNANDEGYCWPSMTHVCEHTGLSRSSVIRHIKSLEAAGLLETKRRSKDGVNLPNHYQLPLPNLEGVVSPCDQGGVTMTPGGGVTVTPKPSVDRTVNEPSEEKARAVRAVFAYWQERTDHPRAKLGDDKRKKIRARLDEGYTVDELKQAVDGCCATPWNMGHNPRKRRYDSIDLIFRNSDKVDQFIAAAEKPMRSNADLAREWADTNNGDRS